jgi:ABC-type Fe3+ transport system permease subunit
MKPKRTKQVAGIIIGSLLLVGSPIVASLSGMWRAFDTLGDSGISDPNRLQSAIYTLLYGGIAGTVLGLIILIISIVYFVRAGRAVQKH